MKPQFIHVGKIYELRTREHMVHSDCYVIDGMDKTETYRSLNFTDPYQTGLVLEKNKRLNIIRCMVGTTDIWLDSCVFICELTPKRVRQLAKSRK